MKKDSVMIHVFECGHVWRNNDVPDNCPICVLETENVALNAEIEEWRHAQDMNFKWVEEADKEVYRLRVENKRCWISVDERLPEEGNKRYLCAYKNGGIHITFYERFRNGNFWMNGMHQAKWITHWMPLPEALGLEE